jgi:hypothetical protein
MGNGKRIESVRIMGYTYQSGQGYIVVLSVNMYMGYIVMLTVCGTQCSFISHS